MTRVLWTKEMLLEEILRLEVSGVALNTRAIYLLFPRLYYAATELYGKWKHALRHAGIDPAKVALGESWTRERFKKRLRARYANGEPMNSGAIREMDAVLYAAGRNLFGSWLNALAAAGFDYEKLNCRASKWTRQRIVALIRKRYWAGEAINSAAMSRISSAIAREFGTWDIALKAAGIDPATARRRRLGWTKDAVVLAIRHAHAAGEPLNDHSVRRCLRSAGRRLFGSWNYALEASGFNPVSIWKRRPRWSKEEVIHVLRWRHKNGEPLTCAKLPFSLLHAATKRFGSWRKALNAAGLESSPRTRRGRRCPTMTAWRRNE